VIATGTEEQEKEFWFLKGMARYESRLIRRDRGIHLGYELPEEIKRVYAFSKERVEILSQHQHKDGVRSQGQIRADFALPDSALETALAMRLLGAPERLDAASLAEMDVEADDSSEVVVGIKDSHNTCHQFVLSKDLGYAAVAYRMRRPQDENVVCEMKMNDFEKVGGIMLPRTMGLDRYMYTRDGARRPVEVKKIQVQEYRLNGPENVPAKYHIEWPSDTRVVHADSGRSFYKRKEPAPLVGKALPELKDLGIELASADADDKVILMCFFDYQQRPSRQMLTELARKAEDLKEKGVAVVCVQASKVERKYLDEWVNKNSIPFPVGMIEANEEKTRFTWGVKSLPWLILTDKEHVVRAEGFGIGELDEKAGGLSNAKP